MGSTRIMAVSRLLIICGFLLLQTDGFDQLRKTGSKAKTSVKSAKTGDSASLDKDSSSPKGGNTQAGIGSKSKGSQSSKRRSSKKKQSGRKVPSVSLPDGGLSFVMEHSLGSDGIFESRNEFTVKVGRSTKDTEVSFNDFVFDKAAALKFAELVKNDEMYSVRVLPKTFAQSTAAAPMASVRACVLEISNFMEAFTFNLDSYGNVIALDYRTPMVTCDRQPKKKVSEGTQFRSKGRISLVQEGKKPDVTKLILAEKNKGAPQKTFFQKYWMFLLIGAVVLLSSGGG